MKQYGKYFLVIIPLVVIGLIMWYFSNIVVYILISYVLSLIGHPLVTYLGKIRIKNIQIPKAIRALLTIIILWSLVFVFFRVFIPLFAIYGNELSQINVESVISGLEEPLNSIEKFINKLQVSSNKDISLQNIIANRIASFFNASLISNILGDLAGLIGNIAIAFLSISFITFFFLKEEELFYNGLFLFISSKYEERVAHVLASIKRLLSRYFIGIGLQITGIILLITIGLTIIGINFKLGLVIGLFAGIFNVIPYLGPIIGTAMGMLLGLATHLDLNFNDALLPLLGYMLIVFVCVQLIDNFVFQPFIYSSSVNAHPLEIFLIIMIGGSLGGVIGMLLAIPIYTIIRVIAKEFFSNFKIVQKITQRL
jgi:predicted PurR-regulated permease PerM